MKKFLFINNALSGTGGARVILNLAKVLIKRGNSVSLLLDRDDNIDFDIPEGVILYVRKGFKIRKVSENRSATTHITPFSGAISTIHNHSFKTIKIIAKKILTYMRLCKLPVEIFSFAQFVKVNKFDCVINNNIYVNVDRIYFESKIAANYYVNFHNSPKEVFCRPEFTTFLSLRTIFSRSKLLSVSEGISKELNGIAGFEQHHVQTIYNPFCFEELEWHASGDSEKLPEEFIVTVSTLTERKRVERAIKAFKQILQFKRQLKLVILGDGHLRLLLQQLVKKLQIEKDVIFVGFQKNPYVYINNANLLMLTSDSEGLPTVIIESLILGTPVVSTDCPTGPNEILNGWGSECLVNISDEVSEDRIIGDLATKSLAILQKNLTKQNIKDSGSLFRFEENTIAQKWEQL
jgi:glycosyltransferase involved in cell wall biosynthesis